MRSRLYTGLLWHQRTSPATNVFRAPIYYLGLDLAELQEIDSRLRLFSYNRANLVSFWDRDHGPRDGSPLRPWIESQLSRVGIDLKGGSVQLVTFPRVLGARFYPVSFWYCRGADGVVLAVMAEVHNTYRDHHNYLLHNGGAPLDWASRPRMAKAFFVSPFIPVDDVTYEFAFTEPGNTISVSVLDYVSGLLVHTASLTLRANELTDLALAHTVLRHGPISIVALVRIHWQALRLLAKGVPLHPHTAPPSEEVTWS